MAGQKALSSICKRWLLCDSVKLLLQKDVANAISRTSDTTNNTSVVDFFDTPHCICGKAAIKLVIPLQVYDLLRQHVICLDEHS